MIHKNFQRWELPYKQESLYYFERVRHRDMPCFLDSCSDLLPVNENGQFDIITSDPVMTVTINEQLQLIIDNRETNIKTATQADISVFNTLTEILKTVEPTPYNDIPFSTGFIGFWSYEMGELLEPEKLLISASNTALMQMGLYLWSLITDHKKKKTWLIVDNKASPHLKNNLYQLFLGSTVLPQMSFTLTSPFRQITSFDDYKLAFQRIQRYITDGDCYEVNFTHQFTAGFFGDAWMAYLHSRHKNPANYSAYLDFPEISLLCFSPEQFLSVNEFRQIETRPIKGTIARGKNIKEDTFNASRLLNSEKERAENIMIVDLLRNDLGKICDSHSISVPHALSLQSNAHVHHLVSTITGTLGSEFNQFDLMRYCFPGGSITGVPKIRTMQIIKELESSPRGVYCGCIGYFNSNQCMNTNIAIRTATIHNNTIQCWGGGAITADSECQQEYAESILKIKGILTALKPQKN